MCGIVLSNPFSVGMCRMNLHVLEIFFGCCYVLSIYIFALITIYIFIYILCVLDCARNTFVCVIVLEIPLCSGYTFLCHDL